MPKICFHEMSRQVVANQEPKFSHMYSQVDDGGDNTTHERFGLESKKERWSIRTWIQPCDDICGDASPQYSCVKSTFMSSFQHESWTGLPHQRGETRRIIKISDEVRVNAVDDKGKIERIQDPVACLA